MNDCIVSLLLATAYIPVQVIFTTLISTSTSYDVQYRASLVILCWPSRYSIEYDLQVTNDQLS